MIRNLFPTPVGIYNFGKKLTSNELNFVKKQKTRINTGNTTSINTAILKSKELSKINNFIEKSVLDYFNTVHSPKDGVSLKMTQSWVNYTEKGQYHHKHAHPNSFVSGVFYVQADIKKDKIFFYREDYNQIKLSVKEYNLWNSDSWWFEVGTGDLILFPSNLIHMVQPLEHSKTRISISFNTFPVGNIGDELDLTKLCLEDLVASKKK